MRVAAVILNWNEPELTERAATSVAEQVDHVYIADNGSRSEVVERLSSFAQAREMTLIRNGVNLGWAAGNNPAIEEAIRGGYEGILIMNNDAVAEPGAVTALVARLRDCGNVAAVQPMVTTASGRRVIHAQCLLDLDTGRTRRAELGRRRHEVTTEPRPAGYVSGEAFLARAKVFERCGAFDERYGMYFEDAEWSVRVRRAGWELEAVPSAVFRHDLSSSIPSVAKAFLFARGRVLFMRWALGKSRLEALWCSAPLSIREIGSYVRRRRLWHAIRGEVAGEVAGLIRRR